MQKERENIITKFRKLWNSLNSFERECLWDILTAMRGNDMGLHDDVKFATTARIRGELLGQRYSRGYTFLNLKQAKCEMLYTSDHSPDYKPHVVKAHFKAKQAHFRQHIRQAIQALNLYRPKSSMRDLQKFLRD